MRIGPAAWFGLLLLLITCVGALSQLGPLDVRGGSGSVSRYYPAPHFRQMEFRLTGEKIEQVENKVYRATNPQFTAFRTNGEAVVIITTPECVLNETDPLRRTVRSESEIQMRTGDGQSSIQGRGFLWRQDGKTLVISNDVRAVLKWTNNAPPLAITSRWFEFDAERRRAVFHEAVRGDHPEMTFTCAVLTVTGSATKTSSNALELIEADGGLEVERKNGVGFARANRGTYRDAEKRLELIGNAEWQFDDHHGRADRMTAWTNAETVEAVGDAVLSFPSRAMSGAGGLLSTSPTTGRSTGGGTITVAANHFTRGGDRVWAEGKVRVSDGTNYLTCDRLEGQQGTRQSADAVATATGNVFVGRSDGGIHAARADYSGARNEVLFTGEPRFVQGEIQGTAGRVVANTLSGEVLADEGVAVTFPLAVGSGTLLDVLPGAKTNRVTAPSSDSRAGVTARVFRLHDRLALFAGDVEAHQLPANGNEPRMRCDELEVRIAADGKHAESLQARHNVICERGTAGVTHGASEQLYTRLECETLTANADPRSGDLVNLIASGGVRFGHADVLAQGERAIYTQIDQLLKLQGRATIENPQAVYSGRELVYNVATEQISGNYDSIRTKPGVLPEADKLLNIKRNE